MMKLTIKYLLAQFVFQMHLLYLDRVSIEQLNDMTLLEHQYISEEHKR